MPQIDFHNACSIFNIQYILYHQSLLKRCYRQRCVTCFQVQQFDNNIKQTINVFPSKFLTNTHTQFPTHIPSNLPTKIPMKFNHSNFQPLQFLKFQKSFWNVGNFVALILMILFFNFLLKGLILNAINTQHYLTTKTRQTKREYKGLKDSCRRIDVTGCEAWNLYMC